MDRFRAAASRGFENCIAAQVAFLRTRTADRNREIGLAHVLRTGIGLGLHGDRFDAEPSTSAHHPAGDVAAIRDQDAMEQGHDIEFP